MPFTKRFLGLDIGTHSIKAVELTQSLRELQGGQMRMHPHASTPEDLPETLQHFVKLHHLETEHVVSAIAGQQISLHTLEFPFRDAKKLAAAVPFAVEGVTPFELDDIVMDWTPIDASPGSSALLVALTHRDNVSQRLSQFLSGGIKPRVLEAEGLVLGNLSSLFDLTGNRLLLDLGHAKTTMCLMIEGRPVSARSIPIAGLALTQCVAEARGCSLEEAEQIKCSESVGSADGQEMLPEATAVLSRICREIVRFLEANQQHTLGAGGSPGIDEVTMMGGTSKLAGIAQVICDRIGFAVHPLGTPIEGENADLISGGEPALFAPAIALALRATSLGTTQLNFRQDEFAYRTNFFQLFSQDLRPTAILAALAAGMALFSFGTSLVLESNRARTLEDRARQLYAEVMPGASSENPVPALSQALREAQDRSDFLGIFGTNQSAVDLLAELSRRIPDDVKVKFEDINIDRRVVKIKVLGESYRSADRLKSLLARSAPFADAEVDKVKSTRGGTGKRFNLTLSLTTEGESS